MQADDRVAARLDWARQAANDPSLELRAASSDASFRSYWRTESGGRSLIVMDSPPELEDPRPWLAIGARLAAAGLHVPAVYAWDEAQGFLLIEDLGSELYLDVLDEHSVEVLYADALDALLKLQTKVDAAGLADYDAAFLQREMALLPEWFLQRHLGQALDPQEHEVLNQAFAVLLANIAEQPRSFVHRDFHSRNLLRLPADEHEGVPANPGVIDFQGALIGPLTYDLASLLRDCYIAWDESRVSGWVEGYRQRLLQARLIEVTVDPARFQRWFDLTGMQRHIKVLGLFCRLCYRDGKPGYLADLPLVYRYVIGVARRYPELNALADLLERRVGELPLTQVRPA